MTARNRRNTIESKMIVDNSGGVAPLCPSPEKRQFFASQRFKTTERVNKIMVASAPILWEKSSNHRKDSALFTIAQDPSAG
jgi:hypothetical protein